MRTHRTAKVSVKAPQASTAKESRILQRVPVEFDEVPQFIIDEVDRVIKDNPPEGQKHDGGKPNWSLMPWDALGEVQGVLDFGARKYGEHNWKHVLSPRTRYLSAMLRHVIAYARGERNDPESGYHHLAHAVCCGLFVIHFEVPSDKPSPIAGI